ncbi:hypothetical protein [Actinomadura rupiterrae]|nr:hypothetical protein [Actinomadura rupiterrae]MCP2337384.1 hypothetical protein [Actinomadura rupiterrae]
MQVDLQPAPPVLTDEEEIVFIQDMDTIASPDAMLGCGDDNPY